MNVIDVMASGLGRIARLVAGLVLVVVGISLFTGPSVVAGLILGAIGLVRSSQDSSMSVSSRHCLERRSTGALFVSERMSAKECPRKRGRGWQQNWMQPFRV